MGATASPGIESRLWEEKQLRQPKTSSWTTAAISRVCRRGSFNETMVGRRARVVHRKRDHDLVKSMQASIDEVVANYDRSAARSGSSPRGSVFTDHEGHISVTNLSSTTQTAKEKRSSWISQASPRRLLAGMRGQRSDSLKPC
ncbi:hypothetical protein MRB53_040135 [Persea americana]|nr:hypothetical protein MRB53_040135 [Persea americana]